MLTMYDLCFFVGRQIARNEVEKIPKSACDLGKPARLRDGNSTHRSSWSICEYSEKYIKHVQIKKRVSSTKSPTPEHRYAMTPTVPLKAPWSSSYPLPWPPYHHHKFTSRSPSRRTTYYTDANLAYSPDLHLRSCIHVYSHHLSSSSCLPTSCTSHTLHIVHCETSLSSCVQSKCGEPQGVEVLLWRVRRNLGSG
jgi:hypothetical protein